MNHYQKTHYDSATVLTFRLTQNWLVMRLYRQLRQGEGQAPSELVASRCRSFDDAMVEDGDVCRRPRYFRTLVVD